MATCLLTFMSSKCNQMANPLEFSFTQEWVNLGLPKTLRSPSGSDCPLPQAGKPFRVLLELVDSNANPWLKPNTGKSTQVFPINSSSYANDLNVDAPTGGTFVWNFSIIDLECDFCCSPECTSGNKYGIPQFTI